MVVVSTFLVLFSSLFSYIFPTVDKVGQAPVPCDQMGGCGGGMLAAWAVGINGLCMNQDVGIRVGPEGAIVASLRVSFQSLYPIARLLHLKFNQN